MIYVDRGHLGETSLLTEIDLASGERKTIVDWPAMNYDPAYSPDGTEIAFASNITGEYAIYRQRLSDGQSWRVTHGKGDAGTRTIRRLISQGGTHASLAMGVRDPP